MKKLSAAQRLMLEQARKGPILYEKLDGYGRRVAGILEDDELLKTAGEDVEITDAGRARLKGRGARRQPAASASKPAPPAKTTGNGHANMKTPARGVPAWYAAARAFVEKKQVEDLASLDRLAGIPA